MLRWYPGLAGSCFQTDPLFPWLLGLGLEKWLALQETKKNSHPRQRSHHGRWNTSLAFCSGHGFEGSLESSELCHRVITWDFFRAATEHWFLGGQKWLPARLMGLQSETNTSKVDRNWHYNQWWALCADPPVESLGSDQWNCFLWCLRENGV